MFNYTSEGRVRVGDTTMNYVTFGKGEKVLVIIPGLGDVFKGVKGLSVLLSYVYKEFADEYKVYVFSRKKSYDVGYSTKDMADDQAIAMKKLGLSDVYVMGISQGGMIAQYLAGNHSGLVKKLVLVVTICRQNKTIQAVIGRWKRWSYVRDFKSILTEMSEKCYEERSSKRIRIFYPMLVLSNFILNRRKFLIQSTACLTHDSYEIASKIVCETLVIGGSADGVVGGRSSELIAKRIQGCELKIYKGKKHGLYYEVPEFKKDVIEYLNKK